MEVSSPVQEEPPVLTFDPIMISRRIDLAGNRITERPQMTDRPPHIQHWLRHFAAHRRALIIAPPGHGKSWAAQDAAIWKIASDRTTSSIAEDRGGRSGSRYADRSEGPSTRSRRCRRPGSGDR